MPQQVKEVDHTRTQKYTRRRDFISVADAMLALSRSGVAELRPRALAYWPASRMAPLHAGLLDNALLSPYDIAMQHSRPARVHLTANATARLKELDTTSAQPIIHLYVAGRTCCGVQYGMAFADEIEEGYSISEFDDVRVVVDPVSLPHCEGAIVDFVVTPEGSGFTVEAPAAAGGGCSCGGH